MGPVRTSLYLLGEDLLDASLPTLWGSSFVFRGVPEELVVLE
jgi:hypothetical protein